MSIVPLGLKFGATSKIMGPAPTDLVFAQNVPSNVVVWVKLSFNKLQIGITLQQMSDLFTDNLSSITLFSYISPDRSAFLTSLKWDWRLAQGERSPAVLV